MKPSLLFIHRSVGRNLINDGEMYRLVREIGQPFILSDFDQNTGLLQSDSVPPKQTGWHFPNNDTKPASYAALFSEERFNDKDPLLRAILAYDIIAIKSCSPNSNIHTETELRALQQLYQRITAFFARQHSKRLIVLTSPPLMPLMTTKANAARARMLTDWLTHITFAPNIFVFDLFNELAVPAGQQQANTLRRGYRRFIPFDSHPNASANRAVAPKVVDFFCHAAA